MFYIYYENITFSDIVNGLSECFDNMGIDNEITSEIKQNNFLDLYIIFGMNDFSSQVVPRNYIVYQLEQTTGNDESKWFNQTYLNYLKKAVAVWDYSLINYKNLRQLGITNINYIPIQYMHVVDKIKQKSWNKKDIDILFIGSFNDRRSLIIEQLKKKRLNIVSKNNIWKDEKDDLISRSKIVLNIHYFQQSILETVRLSHLLSNKCIVVSEKSLDPILDKWHQPYVKFAEYDELAEVCEKLLNDHSQLEVLTTQLIEYKTKMYEKVIPFDKIKSLYSYLLTPNSNSNENSNENSIPISNPIKLQPPQVDSSDIFEAETEITNDRQLILKLPQWSSDQLPNVSIVTPTYNRQDIFPMAIRNWELFEYPREKLEWIIIDDSDNNQNLSQILPKSKQIKYYKLQTTGRLSIGQKRNFGVEKATHDYIVFMDDDDYYYPVSVYARISLLLKYPQYDLVGVTTLDIYDVVDDFCARINGVHVSEASMAFRKSFWVQRPFQNKFNTLGEGYPFIKDRRHQIVKMPSCFNLIALTHWENYTEKNRSHEKFKHVEKKDNLLKILDLQTRLFIFSLFDKVKKNIKHEK